MQDSPRGKRGPVKPRAIPRAQAKTTAKTDGDQHSFTSFKPLSPEKTHGAFSFSKLFQWKNSEPSIPEGNRQSSPSSKFLSSDSSTSSGSRNESPAREHHKSVRSRISKSWSSPRFQRRQSPNLQSKQLPQGYLNLSALLRRLTVAADTSKRDQLDPSYFKQYWMPDENCKECYECGEKFNTFRRRHHCRLCGQIFCYRCCNVEIPGEIMGYSGGLRVCTYCNKIFQTYTQSPDMMSNLQQLQEDIRAVAMEAEYAVPHSSSMNSLTLSRSSHAYDDDEKTSRKTSTASNNSAVFEKLEQIEARQTSALQSTRSPFDAFGVCAAEANILKQGSLRDLWHTIMSQRSGLELTSHRFRLKTYQNCLVASDLVDWLINHEKALTRSQAVVIGQTLLDGGWLEPVPQTRYAQDFYDEYALYQPGPTAMKDQLQAGNPRHSLFRRGSGLEDESSDNVSDNNDDDESAPQWFRQLQGYESGEELDMQESVKADPATPASILTVPKISRQASVKLLDLDVPIGTTEEKESELSLKVNLDHFGEGNESNKGQGAENQGPTLALTTDVPPPPLEHYVYSEGYPISSLRSSNRKPSEPAVVLGTSAEDVLKGALMAKRIGVNRPKPTDGRKLRDDNDERLAMERLCEARFIHMVHLAEQLLQDAGLSLDWKEVILPLVEEISDKVSPDVRNDDDMDIRQYVKFKKIPGGSKNDCQVIWGVGFTKNVSNKKMCSSFNNPRILLLSCAIDFQRNENRLANLDSLVLQEYNFLKNFVARVAALRPNVLLVEKTVSRLAQDMLLQHGITLALNVKPGVIERVARCTKAAVLRSMEQLSRPQLGTCHHFGVQKYLLKNGEAKTLMFLDGCPPELGCTVTLRGGNSLVLAKVKKIVQFLTYIAHGQKLERAFLMDEFALPDDPSNLFNDSSMTSTSENDISIDQEQSLARIFQKSLDRTVLSSSPYVKYPLPYLLTTEGSKCAIRSLLPKDIYWSARLSNKRKTHLLTEEELDEFEPPLSKRLNIKGVQKLSPHPLVLPSVVVDIHDQFIQGVIADFRSQGGRIQLKRNRNVDEERRKSKWLLMDVENCQTENHPVMNDDANKTQARENNTAKPSQVVPTSPIHFHKQVDCLDPNYHQRIAVLFSSYSSESNNSPRPCISPWAVFMEFYGRNDITLGGFLERYCFRPSYVCPNPNCDVPMVDHVRYFAHGNGSVYINMKNLESPIPGFHHTILTWSWCKECKQVTPIVPLSSDAWALSFAKYIELRFYGSNYLRRASIEPCGHSLHRHHFQYFAFANMVASFKYRPIKLFETAIPPPSIFVKKDVREATYWERDVHAISDRADGVFGSVLDRIDELKAEKLDYHSPGRESKLMQFNSQLEGDKSRFSEQVQIVTKKVNVLQGFQNPSIDDHLDKQDQISLGYVIADGLNGLKRILCEIVENWNSRLQEFIQAEKKRSSKSPVTQRDSKSGDKLDPASAIQNLPTKSFEKGPLNSTSDGQASDGLPSTGLSPSDVSSSSLTSAGLPSIAVSSSDVTSASPTSAGLASNDISNADFSPSSLSSGGLFSAGHPSGGLPTIVSNSSPKLTGSDKVEPTDKEPKPSGLDPNFDEKHFVKPINPKKDLDIKMDEETECDSNRINNVIETSTFVRGHRRICSSPPQITITYCPPYENQGLARSYSASDVTGRHTQKENTSSTSSTLTSENEVAISSSPETSTTAKQPDGAGESDVSAMSTDGTPVIRRRDKMKNIISSLLPGSNFHPITSSFPSHEHHLLPAGEKVIVVVNEKEPSSIIAYALSTKEYNHKLCEIKVLLGRMMKESESGQKNARIDAEADDDTPRFEGSTGIEPSSVITIDDSIGEFVNVEIKDLGADYNELDSNSVHVEIINSNTINSIDKVKFSKKPSQEHVDTEDGRKQHCNEQPTSADNTCFPEFGFQPKDAGKDHTLDFHIQMQFSYNVCRFYCNAYYAEQFRNLRKHTFKDGEERYIRSLAHCVVWRARGGKSGSSFSKSLDDRFVLKQMSRLELQSFVEFAPHYFQYMNKAIKEKKSMLLAKIFGVYRIGFKNTQTNITMRQDVLVMENLFYDRKIDKTFDLKGSMRSRYVQVSGAENDVLMDENLLEMIRESPIFIRPHSKAVLSKAIHNDTEFLSQHMVMDYSLLVGIDEMRSELVIGIIDFIRTFTWDKKLEMYVKSSGILGGQGKMPTVVSPELYRTRFTEAMHRYFLMVPDKWTGLGNDLD